MRRKALTFLLLIAILSMGGCGDGGSDEPEERSLTKKQFVRLAEDFCDREYRAEERDMERYADRHGLNFGDTTPEEMEEMLPIVFDYVRDKIAYFKSLPVPAGDEQEVRAMIRAFEEGLEKSEARPELLAPRPGKSLPEPFTDSYHATAEYGPWLCGQP
jgi:hypothetical protein